MASRAFVRNLSNHSGSLIGLIGSLIGRILGFFTPIPLGSMLLGALGGLIGALISWFVGRKYLKRLGLWFEKKLKTRQQRQEEQQQRQTVQATLPALTAS